MKFTKSLATLAVSGALLSGGIAHANTVLLTNPDLSSTENWIAGSNLFVGGEWQGFIGSAGGDYTVESRISTSGDEITFTAYDDGTSDRIESYLFQEFFAGPATSPTPTIFDTGDVIVFKGTARATTEGTDPSDVIVRAFIKTLGYNSQGWAFQVKEEYSTFFPLSTADQSFELSMVYPDLSVDDSLQVIQLGFEITTEFDGAAMDSGTITFSNLEGYVEGDAAATWLGYDVDAQGYANTGSLMGWVWVDNAPWIWSYLLNTYVYVPATEPSAGGEWVYIKR